MMFWFFGSLYGVIRVYWMQTQRNIIAESLAPRVLQREFVRLQHIYNKNPCQSMQQQFDGLIQITLHSQTYLYCF